jgi:hypothetical protein
MSIRSTTTALMLLFAGCGGDRGDSRAVDGKTSDGTANTPLLLVASADTQGWIVPCGCTSNQSGGLLRRATYLTKLQELSGGGRLVYVDAGGAVEGNTPYEMEKLRAIGLGEIEMKISAHNIGEGELKMGPRLVEIAKEIGLPLVSSNVVDGDRKPVVPATRRITSGDTQLLIVGVVSQQFAPDNANDDDANNDANWQVLPPRTAILNAIETAQKPGDQLVVLAYMPQVELVELAQSLPEVHLFVGGPTGQSMAPQKHGPTTVVSVTNKGKFLATMRLENSAGNSAEWSGEIVEMTEQFADDAEQLANLQSLYVTYGQKDFAPGDTPFSLPTQFPASYSVGGTATCNKCHEEVHDQWTSTTHGRAWQSLEKTGAQVDAACQRCHTTGYGYPNGFASIVDARDLGNVGCESCHGPSQRHANAPESPTGFRGQAKSRCVRCHDRENSPDFAEQTYWEIVVH